MSSPIKAIEVAATVADRGQLRLDEALMEVGPGRVRVIVLLPENADIQEREWIGAASRGPAFDFLKDSSEDIYTPPDGKPFHDEDRPGASNTTSSHIQATQRVSF